VYADPRRTSGIADDACSWDRSGLMRVAALYDIHGNLPALRAVLRDVERAQAGAIVIGGDVAAGPLPSQTLQLLMTLGERARFVRGNADREIVEAYDAGRNDPNAEEDPPARAFAFAVGHISRSERDVLAGFQSTAVLDVDGLGPTLFCHGSPRSDSEIITTATSEERLREILATVEQNVVVCGHTHRQFDRSCNGWRVVNAGSVGVPYEGRAGAYWALLGPGVELRRTEYDLDQAVAELGSGGFPDLKEIITDSLLDPVDPDQVAEFFEHQATRAS
jgi:predicted phosphodiesterase